jgi:hypothetical protein
LLILKLPRIPGHGNRLQSGKRGQPLRRAVGTEIEVAGAENYLNPTGLDSDPRLIQKLAALAEHRPGRQR